MKGWNINLRDTVVIKRGGNVRGLTDPRDKRAGVEMKAGGRERVNVQGAGLKEEEEEDGGEEDSVFLLKSKSVMALSLE
ncbi:hypothetical protein NQZ68_026170 [Dissostichus eleginoides]|nr:hypothetical protein NQZ68_026170 [Dissostichus eleginoides]